MSSSDAVEWPQYGRVEYLMCACALAKRDWRSL